MSEVVKPVKLAADVFWAQLDKINEMSGKYQVNLCNLSDKAVDALEAMGLDVTVGEDKKADMGRYITCKSNSPIRSYDKEGLEVVEKIGNGSKCIAMVTYYDWKYKNKSGKSPSLRKLVITDLIPYAEGGDVDDGEEAL